jgi:hypothetical protein
MTTSPALDLETRLRTHLTSKASLAPIDAAATPPWLSTTLSGLPPGSGRGTIALLDDYAPTESRRPIWRYRAIAVAAAFLVAAGIVTLGQSSTKTRTNSTTWNSWPVLLPSYLPPGFLPVTAEITEIGFEIPARVQVFRDSETAPGARAIVVRVSKQPLLPNGTTINGRNLFVSSQSSVVAGFPNGIVLQLAGHGLAPDELRDFALRAKPSSDDPLDGIDIAPVGLTLVADQRLEKAQSTAWSVWTARNGTGSIHLNQRPAGAAEVAEVEEQHTDIDAPPTLLTIGGRPARMWTNNSDGVPIANRPSLELMWSTAAGTLVQLNSSGIGESALRQVAESLHVAGQDEWRNLTGSSDAVTATTAAIAVTSTAGSTMNTAPRTASLDGGPVSRFAPTWFPSGYQVDLADDTHTTSALAVDADRTTIYRDADPLGRRLLQVWAAGGLPAFTIPAEPRDTDLFGDTGPMLASSLARADVGPDHASVLLSGTGLTQPELGAILDSVVLPSPPWSGPATIAVPAGMVMVSDRGSRPVGPEALMMLSSPEQPGHRINIRARPTVTGELQEEMALQPAAVATTVRGHAGYTLQLPTHNATFLVWQETPDVRLQIAGRGIAVETLMRIAEGLKTVTPSEWARLAPAAATTSTSTTRP